MVYFCGGMPLWVLFSLVHNLFYIPCPDSELQGRTGIRPSFLSAVSRKQGMSGTRGGASPSSSLETH